MSLSPPPTDEFHLGPPERDLAILHSGGPNKESLLGGSPQRGGSLRRPLPLQNNLYLASYGRGLERKFLFNVGFAYGSAMIFGSAYGVGVGLRRGGATRKLLINSVINGCTSHGPPLANGFAALSILYTPTRALLSWARGSSSEDISNTPFAGAAAGALYRVGYPLPVVGRYALGAAALFTGVDLCFRSGLLDFL
eukprot:GHVU01211975.1.p1 GENE.GHVU01211975.1~~GHVU01211975.1.p1  ORF type:complete len:195 (-),score=21.61 GHVU01211975.1:219-803(-)